MTETAGSSRDGQIVELKDAEWLRRQKHAGVAVSRVLQNIPKLLEKDSVTLQDIESYAAGVLEDLGCTPTFYQYKGPQGLFPGKICASVNQVLVHGVPSDYRLQNGDVITIDLGATFEGAIADTAFTYLYGKPKTPKIVQMMILCQEALNKGIEQVKPDNRLGAIGAAIHGHVKGSGYGLITEYGGHGINYNKLHAPPFVPNKAREGEGIRIQPGFSCAIEPMLTLTKNVNTRVLRDKWGVVTKDIGCHYEHSVTLDEGGNQHIISEHGLDVKDMYEDFL